MTESEIRVRSYHSRDEQAVVELWATVFPDDPPWSEPRDVIQRKRSVQGELFFVCEVEGRVVGTVLAGFDGVRGWVHHLAVLPDLRRGGLATALMRAAEQGLTNSGCPKLNLQVRATNSEVVAFYKSLGYAIEDRVSLGKPLGQWAKR
jgi:ribosomal protein S18 acetylase RimI-like enzyme